MAFTCIEDPVLCPMAGRCPACTVAFHEGRATYLDSQIGALKKRISDAELRGRLLVRSMLEDSDPDFVRLRQIQAMQSVLRNDA